MKKIGVFYGSSTGSTSELAQRIAKAVGAEAHCYDVANASASDVAEFEVLLLGSSTWGIGELQDDFAGFLPDLAAQDLSGKAVGLFGCGDADSYPDSFCEALAEIKQDLSGSGCRFIGAYTPEGYSYDATRCEEDGKLIGLCIDDVNQSDMTEDRIQIWLTAMKGDL
ncbi:MAG: flavodoxin [Porphyromonadaceae bacterium]|nr:flavodoxin [Porphyromonadaceae bacterium]